MFNICNDYDMDVYISCCSLINKNNKMRLLILFSLLPFISISQSKNTLESENERLMLENRILKSENDSLKAVLKKCIINNQMFLLNLNEKKPTFSKETKISPEQKEKILLSELNSKPDSIKKRASQVIKIVDEFVEYCNLLKENIIQITGGYDDENRPVGRANVEDVEELLLNQGKATELKNKLITLRTDLLKLAPNGFSPSQLNTTDISQHNRSDTTWEAYTFGRMPMIAIIPMIGKFRNDAIKDKILILELWVSRI